MYCLTPHFLALCWTGLHMSRWEEWAIASFVHTLVFSVSSAWNFLWDSGCSKEAVITCCACFYNWCLCCYPYSWCMACFWVPLTFSHTGEGCDDSSSWYNGCLKISCPCNFVCGVCRRCSITMVGSANISALFFSSHDDHHCVLPVYERVAYYHRLSLFCPSRTGRGQWRIKSSSC